MIVHVRFIAFSCAPTPDQATFTWIIYPRPQ
jgi:hypothetical protein